METVLIGIAIDVAFAIVAYLCKDMFTKVRAWWRTQGSTSITIPTSCDRTLNNVPKADQGNPIDVKKVVEDAAERVLMDRVPGLATNILNRIARSYGTYANSVSDQHVLKLGKPGDIVGVVDNPWETSGDMVGVAHSPWEFENNMWSQGCSFEVDSSRSVPNSELPSLSFESGALALNTPTRMAEYVQATINNKRRWLAEREAEERAKMGKVMHKWNGWLAERKAEERAKMGKVMHKWNAVLE